MWSSFRLTQIVSVDEEIELARQYGIRSMSTFLVIQAGQGVDQISGARSKAEPEARFAALAALAATSEGAQGLAGGTTLVEPPATGILPANHFGSHSPAQISRRLYLQRRTELP